jgi:branched-chain amino acid transport system substrate-binding protein
VAIQEYSDFVIFTDDVNKDDHDRVISFSVLVFWSLAGEGKKETVNMPQTDLEVFKRRLENRELDADFEQQIRFGELLADLLLPKKALQMFEESFSRARDKGKGLRIRLRLIDELVSLPWEYMYVRSQVDNDNILSGFLALNKHISIVRHEALQIPAEGFRTTEKRRVVVAMATPRPYNNYRKLVDLPKEQNLIEEALNRVAGIDAIYLPLYRGHYENDIPSATVEDLKAALAQETDIVHFSGHGKFNKELGPGGQSLIGKGFIILADANNQAVEVSAESLLEILCGKGVRLVILGACNTGERDVFNAWNSVAASLLRGEIPVVIAMQFSIYSYLATAFMDALYESLIAGLSIDEAVSLGRVAIRAKAMDENNNFRDWGVPVLYLRTEGGCVFDPVTDSEALEAALKKVRCLSLFQLGMQERATEKKLESKKPPKRVKPRIPKSLMTIIGSVIIGIAIGTLVIDLPTPVYTLTIMVNDAYSGMPLVGAEIFLNDEYKGVIPSSGSIIIRDVSEGNHVVKAIQEQYHESMQGIEVTTNSEIAMQLMPKTLIINFFTADDSMLNWSVFGASSIIISPGIGGVESTGSRLVSPVETTIYTLTASNEAGSKSMEAVVTRTIPRVIQIGITSPNTPGLETLVPFVEEILEPDIAEYVSNRGLNYRFDFLIEDNQGTAAIALEKTQTFKAMGINIIIGHGWSSQCQASLSYVNENDMLLLSASSTSPLLAIPDDNLFRACPTDLAQSLVLAQMWKTWGVEAVLTIQRADSWGDGLWNILEREWINVGIHDLGRIRYPREETDFSDYLTDAENIVTTAIEKYGKEKVGLQVFSLSEIKNIQNLAAEFPSLMDIIWMTTDDGGRSQEILNEAGEWATKTRHFSPMNAVVDSIEFREFDEIYYDLTGSHANYYTTVLYDACRLLVECIIETGSTDSSEIAEVLIPMSQDYTGFSGIMTLDENGDRLPQVLDIWGFYRNTVTGDNLFMKFGEYDGQLNEVYWDDISLESYAGILRPGA